VQQLQYVAGHSLVSQAATVPWGRLMHLMIAYWGVTNDDRGESEMATGGEATHCLDCRGMGCAEGTMGPRMNHGTAHDVAVRLVFGVRHTDWASGTALGESALNQTERVERVERVQGEREC